MNHKNIADARETGRQDAIHNNGNHIGDIPKKARDAREAYKIGFADGQILRGILKRSGQLDE